MLQGHADQVTAMLALDRGRVISGSMDTTLRVWDVATGASLQTLTGHSDKVWAVVALDGRRVVSRSWYELQVWDIATGATLRSLTGHTGSVTALAALDAQRVISGSKDGTLSLWEIASGECLLTLEGHTDEITTIATLDAKRVVSASADGTLRIWKVDTAQCEAVFSADSRLTAICIPSPSTVSSHELNLSCGDSRGGVHSLRWRVSDDGMLRPLQADADRAGRQPATSDRP
jgi:WD40 repeat protein